MVHGRVSGRVRVRAGYALPVRWIVYALAVPAALMLTAWSAHGESGPGLTGPEGDCCVRVKPASGGMVHPAGVPDLADPAVQASFVPLDTVTLNGDPNFPGLFLGNITGEYPQFLLVILDARNGKETWSLREDAAIFFLLLTGPGKVRRAFLDEGFASRGNPSGTFMEGGPEGALHLLERLRETHQQSSRPARLRPAARRP